ncbi:unnamed protein product [Linum trigynum]|uniref:Endonuclease/exonuclease/phosphatase domain-containing protein n=1 Tax=Linum trigynum TaxID=586398 RepID=A0AAV2ESD2_9ROSI
MAQGRLLRVASRPLHVLINAQLHAGGSGSLLPLWLHFLSYLVIMLDVFSWNCQGAGHEKFVSILRSFFVPTRPEIVIIVEPRISGSEAQKVISQIGFDGVLRVDAVGFASGIWVLWNEHELEISKLEAWEQMILFSCRKRGGREPLVVIFAVYGSPQPARRQDLWDKMGMLGTQITEPWLLAGDFNSIIGPKDRMGGGAYLETRVRAFRNCLNACGLMEMGLTWRRGGLSQRLDWAVCNKRWFLQFPDSISHHLERVGSYHRPLRVYTEAQAQTRGTTQPFRFLAAWLGHEDFRRFLEASWHPDLPLPTSLERLRDDLQSWNRRVFGNIFRRKRELAKRLRRMEEFNETSATIQSCEKEEEVWRALELTLW